MCINDDAAQVRRFVKELNDVVAVTPPTRGWKSLN
jgi:hypothetical protein